MNQNANTQVSDEQLDSLEDWLNQMSRLEETMESDEYNEWIFEENNKAMWEAHQEELEEGIKRL